MKKIMAVIFTIVLLLNLCACADVSTITMDASSSETGDAVKISYVADFYDNYGDQWLSVEGNSFNISPNKIKEYSYDSDGSWISNWTTSSVMSIDIDGNKIDIVNHPKQIVKIKVPFMVNKLDMIRIKK